MGTSEPRSGFRHCLVQRAGPSAPRHINIRRVFQLEPLAHVLSRVKQRCSPLSRHSAYLTSSFCEVLDLTRPTSQFHANSIFKTSWKPKSGPSYLNLFVHLSSTPARYTPKLKLGSTEAYSFHGMMPLRKACLERRV